MRTERHGLSIGIERINDDFYLTIKAVGKLTHTDYQKITPLIDSALEGVKQQHVKALVDASELQGWELRAAWDDLKLGLKHNNDFAKVALYGNKRWEELSAKIGSWFMSGEMKYFEDIDAAINWLEEN